MKKNKDKAPNNVIACMTKLIAICDNYIAKRDAQNRNKPLSMVATNDQYNASGWLGLDRNLNDAVVSVLNGFVTRQAYSFGHSKVGFSYGDGSILLSESCHCPNKTVSHQDKKTERAKAESFLSAWLKKAKDWNSAGQMLLDENPETNGHRPTDRASETVKKGYTYQP